jgi:hypothetical protein
MNTVLRLRAITLVLSLISIPALPAHAARDLKAAAVEKGPEIDGRGDDAVWKSAEALAVKDGRSGDTVTLKALRRGDTVYFLVQFPDAAEDRLHKPWVWDKEMEVYKLGPQREDGFTFKWNMEERDVDLSNFSDDVYHADVWYWKANRTDPAGYADDKHHILTSEPAAKAKELKTGSGKSRYLQRLGDAGTSAQKKRLLTDYEGDVQDQYESRKPDGSRADVLTRGVWKKGTWTIEFARKFDTGQDDDVRFDAAAGKKYPFGVSIFGLYGEEEDDSKAHLYGQGRISEKLYLVFP